MLTSDIINHFVAVCRKPDMFIQSSRYDAVCAYINGFDVALQHGPLVGFREWLLTRGDSWTTMPWWAIVRQQAFPGEDVSLPLGDSANPPACLHLASALEDFGGERDHVGLSMIFHVYHNWIMRRKEPSTVEIRKRLRLMKT
ncbi:hypothetical protein ACNOYE_02510 [Nannocystaceae bacterium ST9]